MSRLIYVTLLFDLYVGCNNNPSNLNFRFDIHAYSKVEIYKYDKISKVDILEIHGITNDGSKKSESYTSESTFFIDARSQ